MFMDIYKTGVVGEGSEKERNKLVEDLVNEMDIDFKVSNQNLEEDISNENDELRKTLRAAGVFRPVDMKHHEKFFRIHRYDPFNYVDGAIEYIFITKPDLPILNNEGTDLDDLVLRIPYFADLKALGYMQAVIQNLCFSYSGGSDSNFPFIRILTNRKTANMDLPDISVDEFTTATNMYGSQVIYSKSSEGSEENIDFTLEFEDTKYLEIYHLFKAYDLFRQYKDLGIMGPGVFFEKDVKTDNNNAPPTIGAFRAFRHGIRDAIDSIVEKVYEGDREVRSGVHARYLSYVTNRILYDHMSIYKIMVANDGQTILHIAKNTGIFPKTISRSSFSEIPDRGPLKITVGFKGSGWLEDAEFAELSVDFNALIYNYVGGKKDFLNGNIDVPIWDDVAGRVSQENVDFPFIRKWPNNNQQTSEKFGRYLLCWGNL